MLTWETAWFNRGWYTLAYFFLPILHCPSWEESSQYLTKLGLAWITLTRPDAWMGWTTYWMPCGTISNGGWWIGHWVWFLSKLSALLIFFFPLIFFILFPHQGTVIFQQPSNHIISYFCIFFFLFLVNARLDEWLLWKRCFYVYGCLCALCNFENLKL